MYRNLNSKSLTVAASALILSTSVNASIVSVDWQTAGDNLITQDTDSGLGWLDLTETHGMSYNFVSGQLGTGGQFEGFRYANDSEVIALFAQFAIDLSSSAVTSVIALYPNAQTISTYFGVPSIDAQTGHAYTVVGMTSDIPPSASTAPHSPNLFRNLLGSYYVQGDRTYFNLSGGSSRWEVDADYDARYGSFLVRETAVVPVPQALWLFGSGLLVLIGATRKKV